MDTEKKEIEMKVRSSQACIRDGYQLYSANFRKIFRATWWLAIGFALLAAVAQALPVLISPTLLLPASILAIVAVGLWLAAAKWRLKKLQMLPPVTLRYGSWLAHVGKLLLVSIVCLVIVAALALLTTLPTVILITANWQSQVGMLYGDPSGMPENVKWLSIAVFAIAGFIQAYVWLTMVLPMYLVKMSMYMQDKEKDEFNKKTI
ncbi:hypothetical protein SAMN04488494_2054 [Xylanibacter ruminicola]|uniref:DUF975 family protein n=1 Tax=Xylanibacter ruminicola TaxID=839 RepID=A0A1M7JG48_XYLRU|nr:hypothetical protein [Xylanibacter ruminicola]SFC71019.1 hypothetical protein SAMN04488493_1164 [Xylanibacter ruminicola]SHM52012.1 hypothetical protein SAMN04488494_2054 [Xylanibacter ruminicola]